MPRERRPSAAGPNRRARVALRCFFRRTRRMARRATRRRNASLRRQEERIRGVTVTKKTKTKTVAKLSASASAALRDANHFLLNTYKRPPIVFTHGKGCTVFDAS